MPKKTIHFEPKEILCPIDFSELSDLALRYAAAGAQQFNANMTVFHAAHIELPRYFTRGVADQISSEIQSVQEDYQTHMAQHVRSVLGASADKLSMRYSFKQAHPVDAILKATETGGTDLVVMGTRGFDSVKSLLIGSVTHGVLGASNVPVFIVRQKEHDFIDITKSESVPQIKNVLCPCKPGRSAGPGLRYAVSLSEHFHARLTVLNISEGTEDDDSQAAEHELCDWISGTLTAQCEFNAVVRKGNAAEQIIAYAKEEKSDLIVMSAHHRSFLGGTFFGRTTDLVARYAPFPVLTVPTT